MDKKTFMELTKKCYDWVNENPQHRRMTIEYSVLREDQFVFWCFNSLLLEGFFVSEMNQHMPSDTELKERVLRRKEEEIRRISHA